QRLRRLTVEGDPQIHAAVVAEASNRIAGLRVDGREVAACNEQQPAIRAIGTLPIVHPAPAHRSLRLPAPDLLAGRGVHSHPVVASALPGRACPRTPVTSPPPVTTRNEWASSPW